VSVVVTVVAPAGRERAWALWTDFAEWPSWNPQCVEARLHGPLAPGSRLELHLRHPRGRDFYTRPRLSTVEPPDRLAWQVSSLGLRATTTTTLEPEPDGTRMTIAADAHGGLAFTYKMTLTERAQADMYVAMLDALSASLAAR
jgi:uncharacterized protein YndB with AHSA1/START domain